MHTSLQIDESDAENPDNENNLTTVQKNGEKKMTSTFSSPLIESKQTPKSRYLYVSNFTQFKAADDGKF